jgi:hypothetical protein
MGRTLNAAGSAVKQPGGTDFALGKSTPIA